MAFKLGNFNIAEILYGVAQDFDGNLLYALDELKNASITVSSEKDDITDKKGNIVRSIYKTKSAEFSATNAFLNPFIMNAASGIDIESAEDTSEGIVMPAITVYTAGTTAVLPASETIWVGTDEAETVHNLSVIGLYGSGATSKALKRGGNTQSSASLARMEYGYNDTTHTLYLPAQKEGNIEGPVNYLVKYDRVVTSGFKLANTATSFPDTVTLTLFCACVDPCDDNYKPCYVVFPSFQASPETTINFDSENQEMDFNGTVQVDYCSGTKELYYIYFPDENIVTSPLSE